MEYFVTLHMHPMTEMTASRVLVTTCPANGPAVIVIIFEHILLHHIISEIRVLN